MKNSETIELNRFLAENVMGWKLRNYETGKLAKTPEEYADAATNDGWAWYSASHQSDKEAWEWQPSADAACAFKVLKAIAKHHANPIQIWERSGVWRVSQSHRTDYEEAETLELAICYYAKNLFSK